MPFAANIAEPAGRRRQSRSLKCSIIRTVSGTGCTPSVSAISWRRPRGHLYDGSSRCGAGRKVQPAAMTRELPDSCRMSDGNWRWGGGRRAADRRRDRQCHRGRSTAAILSRPRRGSATCRRSACGRAWVISTARSPGSTRQASACLRFIVCAVHSLCDDCCRCCPNGAAERPFGRPLCLQKLRTPLLREDNRVARESLFVLADSCCPARQFRRDGRGLWQYDRPFQSRLLTDVSLRNLPA